MIGEFIKNVVVIAVLVCIGMWFLWFRTTWLDSFKHSEKKAVTYNMKKRICNWISGIFLALGIAFFGGSFLAYFQQVTEQIAVLAVVGCICLFVALVVFIVGKWDKKENRG